MASKPPNRSNRPGNNKLCYYCASRQQNPHDTCPAKGQTFSYCNKTSHFASKCQQATRDMQKPTPAPPGSRSEHIRMVHQGNLYTSPEEPYYMKIASQSQTSTQYWHTCNHSTFSLPFSHQQRPFCCPWLNELRLQPKDATTLPDLDSITSCNTLPYSQLSNMLWARLLPTKTLQIIHHEPTP